MGTIVIDKTYMYPYKRNYLLFAINANKIIDYVLNKRPKMMIKKTH